jgi:hypothetical protein
VTGGKRRVTLGAKSVEAGMKEMRVECYAGYRGDERPLRFTLRGRAFDVEEVEDRWYSPGAIYFRVRASDGNYYVLRHDEGMDVWTLDAFRAHREAAATAATAETSSPGPVGAC